MGGEKIGRGNAQAGPISALWAARGTKAQICYATVSRENNNQIEKERIALLLELAPPREAAGRIIHDGPEEYWF